MKTSRRRFLKTAATGMGTATLAGLGVPASGATEFDAVQKWDFETDGVVIGYYAIVELLKDIEFTGDFARDIYHGSNPINDQA